MNYYGEAEARTCELELPAPYLRAGSRDNFTRPIDCTIPNDAHRVKVESGVAPHRKSREERHFNSKEATPPLHLTIVPQIGEEIMKDSSCELDEA